MTVETKILLKNSLNEFKRCNNDQKKEKIVQLKQRIAEINRLQIMDCYDNYPTAAMIFLRIYKKTDLCKN